MIRSVLQAICVFVLCGNFVIAQDDPIGSRLAGAKQDFAKELASARDALVKLLSEKKVAVQNAGNLQLLEIVMAEEAAFASSGDLPQSVQTRAYSDAMKKARKKLEDSYVEARKVYTQAGKIDAARRVDKELQELTSGVPAELEAGRENNHKASINLLSQIDPQLDAIRGVWRLHGKSLIGPSPDEDQARIGIPVWPNGDYELFITFTRLEGPHGLGLTLPIGNRQVNLVIDDGVVGLQKIDGKFFYDESNPTRGPGIHLVDNKKSTLIARVSMDKEDVARIQIDLEGKQVVNWMGRPSQLSMDPNWILQDHRTLGLHAWGTVLRFDEIRLRMLSGEAKRPWNTATK